LVVGGFGAACGGGEADGDVIASADDRVGEFGGTDEGIEDGGGEADGFGLEAEHLLEVIAADFADVFEEGEDFGVVRGGGAASAEGAEFLEVLGGADELFSEVGAVTEDGAEVAGEDGIGVEGFDPLIALEGGFEEVFEGGLGAAEAGAGDGGGEAGSALIEEADEIGGTGGEAVVGRIGERGGISEGVGSEGLLGVVDGLLGVDDALVDFLDVFEVKVDEAAEFFGGGVAIEEIEGHAAGEEGEEVWAVGEGVGLAVAGELEAVFEVAEEEVGGGEAGVFGVGEEVFVAKADEGKEGGGIAEPGGAAAVDALEALDEEFDIADAAPGEFDIEALGAAAGVEFLVDAFAGFGHGLDGGEIEGGGVDHGLDPLEEVAARGAFAGGDAGLEEHLEFPVAGAGAVVLFGGVEGDADFAEAAIGAEAEVDAVAEAFGGVGGEEVRETGGDFLEELAVGDGVFAVGLAVALIEEEEVDVGAVVEFVGSEFTEGEDGEAALVAGGEAGGAVAGDEVEAKAAVGDVEEGVGDVGEFVGDLGEGGEAEDIAEEDAEDLAAAETGEADGFGDTVGGGKPAFEFRHHLNAGTDAVKPAGFEDGEEPVGVLEDFFGEEIGRGEDREEGLQAERDGGDVLEVAGVAVAEALGAEEGGVGVGGLGEKDLEAGAELGGDGAEDTLKRELLAVLFRGGGLVQQSGLSPRRRCRGGAQTARPANSRISPCRMRPGCRTEA